MDGAVIVFTVLGGALVVAVGALIFYRPEENQAPSFSRKQLERLYEDQYGTPPDFASQRDRGGEEDNILRGVGEGVGEVLGFLLSGPWIG